MIQPITIRHAWKAINRKVFLVFTSLFFVLCGMNCEDDHNYIFIYVTNSSTYPVVISTYSGLETDNDFEQSLSDFKKIYSLPISDSVSVGIGDDPDLTPFHKRGMVHKIFVTKQSYFDDFSLRQIISNNMYDTCYTIYLSRYANVRYPELKFDFND